VTEFAGLTESLVVPSVNAQNDEWVNGLLARQPFLTRLFTRISAHEMDEDPIFMANGNADLSNQIDLSTRVAAAQCAGSVSSQACALTYCGEGATCATDELGAEGCVCADGDVAREITAPDFTLQVVCQPEGDFLGEIDENVCEQNSCGENGSCVAVEGFATCRCDEGFFASNTLGRLECLAIAEEFIDDVDWPEDFYATPAEMVASRALNLGANPFVMFGVLLLAGKAWRWRRRHNESLKPNS